MVHTLDGLFVKEITTDTAEEKREDAMVAKKTKPATPDNLGSETHNVKQNTKSAKSAFMLDCQKYGPYGEGQCNKAWAALNNSPASPKKSEDKSLESGQGMDNQTVKGRDMVDERITKIEEALGKKAAREFLPPQPGDVDRTYADVTKAVNELGYNPATTIEDGLARFVQWLRQNA